MSVLIVFPALLLLCCICITVLIVLVGVSGRSAILR